MKSSISVFIFFVSSFCCVAQSAVSKGSLLLGVQGGYRGTMSLETKSNSFYGPSIMYCAAAWNVQGKIGYELAKVPLSLGIQTGVQWNENVHHVGIYAWKKDFKNLKLGYRALNFGVWMSYAVLKKGNHKLNVNLAANALYMPFDSPDLNTTELLPYGTLFSKDGNDSVRFYRSPYSISNSIQISWQLETGLQYSYVMGKNFELQFIAKYQLGFAQFPQNSYLKPQTAVNTVINGKRKI